MSFLTQAAGMVSSYQSVMNLINSTVAQDVVFISDENGNQVFEVARIMKVGVNLDSELFEHPLEDGNEVADFKIDKPTVVQLGMMLPTYAYGDTYSRLRQAKKDGTQFTIATRAGVYEKLIIQAMPHEESPEYGDCLAMSITFREVQWYTAVVETLPAKEVAANPKTGAKSDADTVKQGQKRSTEASAATQKKQESILKGWFG